VRRRGVAAAGVPLSAGTMPRRRGSRGHPNAGLHARQRRVTATAALALKREFEQLLDAGKLFRFCGRDLRGRTFTVYSFREI
jgi:hypothetical protein